MARKRLWVVKEEERDEERDVELDLIAYILGESGEMVIRSPPTTAFGCKGATHMVGVCGVPKGVADIRPLPLGPAWNFMSQSSLGQVITELARLKKLPAWWSRDERPAGDYTPGAITCDGDRWLVDEVASLAVIPVDLVRVAASKRFIVDHRDQRLSARWDQLPTMGSLRPTMPFWLGWRAW